MKSNLHTEEERIIELFLAERFDVAIWLRDRGFSDTNVLTMEEVQEVMEDFILSKKQALQSALASYRQVMREEVEGMKIYMPDHPCTYIACPHYPWIYGQNTTLDKVATLLQDECKHGVPTSSECTECLQQSLGHIEKQPYNQRDHRHCYDDQKGHENHPKCCLCLKPATN